MTVGGTPKVIVAGGTGLIGRALVPALAASGTEVVVLSRQPEREKLPGARMVGWDGRTVSPEWADELAGAVGVVNVAGASIGSRRWTKRRKQLILTSRTGSTGALVDDFAIHSVGRAVHVLNAPSPAATASLEIGATIAARLELDAL